MRATPPVSTSTPPPTIPAALPTMLELLTRSTHPSHPTPPPRAAAVFRSSCTPFSSTDVPAPAAMPPPSAASLSAMVASPSTVSVDPRLKNMPPPCWPAHARAPVHRDARRDQVHVAEDVNPVADSRAGVDPRCQPGPEHERDVVEDANAIGDV
eukprot:150099-Rhodomonas_salina.1